MNILLLSSPNDQAAGIVSYDIAKILSKNHNILIASRNTPIAKYNFDVIAFEESKTIKKSLRMQ